MMAQVQQPPRQSTTSRQGRKNKNKADQALIPKSVEFGSKKTLHVDTTATKTVVAVDAPPTLSLTPSTAAETPSPDRNTSNTTTTNSNNNNNGRKKGFFHRKLLSKKSKRKQKQAATAPAAVVVVGIQESPFVHVPIAAIQQQQRQQQQQNRPSAFTIVADTAERVLRRASFSSSSHSSKSSSSSNKSSSRRYSLGIQQQRQQQCAYNNATASSQHSSSSVEEEETEIVFDVHSIEMDISECTQESVFDCAWKEDTSNGSLGANENDDNDNNDFASVGSALSDDFSKPQHGNDNAATATAFTQALDVMDQVIGNKAVVTPQKETTANYIVEVEKRVESSTRTPSVQQQQQQQHPPPPVATIEILEEIPTEEPPPPVAMIEILEEIPKENCTGEPFRTTSYNMTPLVIPKQAAEFDNKEAILRETLSRIASTAKKAQAIRNLRNNKSESSAKSVGSRKKKGHHRQHRQSKKQQASPEILRSLSNVSMTSKSVGTTKSAGEVSNHIAAMVARVQAANKNGLTVPTTAVATAATVTTTRSKPSSLKLSPKMRPKVKSKSPVRPLAPCKSDSPPKHPSSPQAADAVLVATATAAFKTKPSRGLEPRQQQGSLQESDNTTTTPTRKRSKSSRKPDAPGSTSRVVRKVSPRKMKAAPDTVYQLIYLLLLQSETKLFELIQLHYPVVGTTVGNIIEMIPDNSTEVALGQQQYTGLMRAAVVADTEKDQSPTCWMDASLVASDRAVLNNAGIAVGEIIVAIPARHSVQNLVHISKQILSNPQIQELLAKNVTAVNFDNDSCGASAAAASASCPATPDRSVASTKSGKRKKSKSGHSSKRSKRSMMSLSRCDSITTVDSIPSVAITITAPGRLDSSVASTTRSKKSKRKKKSKSGKSKASSRRTRSDSITTMESFIEEDAARKQGLERAKMNADLANTIVITETPQKAIRTAITTPSAFVSAASSPITPVATGEGVLFSYRQDPSYGGRFPSLLPQRQFASPQQRDTALAGSYTSWSKSFNQSVSSRYSVGSSSSNFVAASPSKRLRRRRKTKMLRNVALIMFAIVSTMVMRYYLDPMGYAARAIVVVEVAQQDNMGWHGLAWFFGTFLCFAKLQWLVQMNIQANESKCPIVIATAKTWKRLKQSSGGKQGRSVSNSRR